MSIVKRLLQTPIGKQFVSAITDATAVARTETTQKQEETRPSRRTVVANDEVTFRVEPDTNKLTQDLDQILADDTVSYLQTYAKLPWVFTSVDSVAAALTQIPIKVIRPKSSVSGKFIEEISFHPMLRLFKNPNNLSTCWELIYKTVAYMLLAGNAYWFLEKNDVGDVYKIHQPRPDRVKPIPQTNGTKKFSRLVNGRDESKNGRGEDWDMTNVVHFSWFSPLSDFVGLPRIAPATDSMILDLWTTKFDKSYFMNAERPKQVVETDQILDDDAYERAALELNRLHKGVDKFHSTAIFDAGMELKELRNQSHTDSDYINHKKLIRDETLACCGAYHLVALLGGANRAILDKAYSMFWRMTVKPVALNIQETLTKELLIPFYDAELEVLLDMRQIESFLEDADAMSLMHWRYWQMGVKSGSEIRSELGESEPLEWSDDPPPSIPFARTRFDPNETRGQMEQNFAHPEVGKPDITSGGNGNFGKFDLYGGNGKFSESQIRAIVRDELGV